MDIYYSDTDIYYSDNDGYGIAPDDTSSTAEYSSCSASIKSAIGMLQRDSPDEPFSTREHRGRPGESVRVKKCTPPICYANINRRAAIYRNKDQSGNVKSYWSYIYGKVTIYGKSN